MRDDILLNFLNIEHPTIKQVLETVKVLIKKDLGITDDLYSINSMTGQKYKKISITPTSVDPVTDEDITINIAKTEIAVVATDLDLKLGLTDEQVLWVKDKVAQIELWKDTAVTKLTEIDSRLTTLETKAANAVIKFNQIDVRLAAIEARLTAHHI